MAGLATRNEETEKEVKTMSKAVKISFAAAKKRAKNKIGVLDMATLTEGRNKLVLFHGPRGGHRATYNRTTKEFWYV